MSERDPMNERLERLEAVLEAARKLVEFADESKAAAIKAVLAETSSATAAMMMDRARHPQIEALRVAIWRADEGPRLS